MKKIYILFLLISVLTIFFSGIGLFSIKYSMDISNSSSLKISSNPQGANIVLNGENISEKTPIMFSPFPPGQYALTVNLEGYYPFEENIVLNGGEKKSFTADLKKKRTAQLIVPGDIKWIKDIPNSNRFLFGTTKDRISQIFIYNTQSKKTSLLSGITSTATFPFEWSANGKKMLLLLQNGSVSEFAFYDSEKISIEKIFTIFNEYFEDVKWSVSDKNVLFGLKNNIIYKLDIKNKTAEKIISDRVDDFFGDDSYAYYIVKDNTKNFLKRTSLNSLSDSVQVPLQEFAEYKLMQSSKSLISLYDQRKKEFFGYSYNIFDDSEDKNSLIFTLKVKNIYWDAKYDDLIVYSDNFVNIYYGKDKTAKTVDRTSDSILKAIFIDESSIAILSTRGDITLLNTDNDKFFQEMVYTSVGARDIISDNGKQVLYFLGVENEKPGIYKIDLF